MIIYELKWICYLLLRPKPLHTNIYNTTNTNTHNKSQYSSEVKPQGPVLIRRDRIDKTYLELSWFVFRTKKWSDEVGSRRVARASARAATPASPYSESNILCARARAGPRQSYRTFNGRFFKTPRLTLLFWTVIYFIQLGTYSWFVLRKCWS